MTWQLENGTAPLVNLSHVGIAVKDAEATARRAQRARRGTSGVRALTVRGLRMRGLGMLGLGMLGLRMLGLRMLGLRSGGGVQPRGLLRRAGG